MHRGQLEQRDSSMQVSAHNAILGNIPLLQAYPRAQSAHRACTKQDSEQTAAPAKNATLDLWDHLSNKAAMQQRARHVPTYPGKHTPTQVTLYTTPVPLPHTKIRRDKQNAKYAQLDSLATDHTASIHYITNVIMHPKGNVHKSID